MAIIFADTETYSETPIKNGTYAYAANAQIMVFALATDDGTVAVVDCTDPKQAKQVEHIKKLLQDPEHTWVFHNSMFDRNVIKYAWGIELPPERIHDVMIRALTHGLPGSLDKLCEIMKVPADLSKSKEGRAYINLFCKPQPANRKLNRATRETHPTEWAGFLDYARLDIEAMRVLYKTLPRWNYQGEELALWHLDQRINDRGFLVDTALAEAAINTVADEQLRLGDEVSDITDGMVTSANKRDALLKHILIDYGVDLPDMKAATLERRLFDDNLPQAVRDLIAIRLQVSTTSTAKYKALVNAVSSDGRLRGTLQFCGASRTGRWSGRTFQPQNLPRPTHKQWEIDIGIEAIKTNTADILFGNGTMKLISSCVRGCIIAPEGMKLVVSDLSNIEGRVAAWLAGEDWKLQAFRNYDNGNGQDLYRIAYSKAFNIDVSEVDGGADKGPHRQIGKVMELMLQYEGGVGAFITGALTYGIDLDAMADVAWANIPSNIITEAQRALDWAKKKNRTYGLNDKTYIVCDALKRLWRNAHAGINPYWKELEAAAMAAVWQPNTVQHCRKLKFTSNGGWLRMILPSGRALCYAAPRVEENKLTYLGLSPYSRQWKRLGTYGGKLFENACQSVARDVMTANMPMVEQLGFEPILSVHDELLTYTPNTPEYSAAYLSELLATQPAWAPDIPLAAGGFEATRYKKD